MAATAVVAAVLTAQVGAPALADQPPSESFFDPRKCQSFPGTEEAEVVGLKPWHLERLQMEKVWKIATGKGVKVAVIDTGASPVGSPFFEGRSIQAFDYLGGFNDEDNKRNAADCEHGTVVMSVLGAGRPGGNYADRRVQFAGIAPDVELVTYRTLHSSGASETPEALAPTVEAVRHATEIGVDIINLSQSVGPNTPGIDEYQAAVQNAIRQGIVVVAAAGNADGEGNRPAAQPPATFDGVIAVGMTDRTDAPEAASLPGSSITLGAPGVDLVGLLPANEAQNAAATNQPYRTGVTGTSFAAPIVSGVVALLLERNPNMTPEQIRNRLVATADPPSTSVPSAQLGYGLVNPLRALSGAVLPPDSNPNARNSVAPAPYEMPGRPDLRPALIGVGIGVGALLVTVLGLVAAIALPPARRRARRKA